MYRQSNHRTQAPTVIEYAAYRFRLGYVLLGIVVLLVGIASIGGLHATRISCVREGAACQIRRYALARSLDVTIPLADIAGFDVQVRTGSKGSKYAEVTLVTTRQSGRPNLELESGGWGHVSPDTANEVRSRFVAFARGGASFDAWLTLGPLTNVFLTLFGIAFLVAGVALFREQFGQLRKVRIVVDHARSIVVVRGKEIPWNEIRDAKVEVGRALFWSSGKNEYVVGHRLVLVRTSGAPLPVTKEFRAGDDGPHEQARDLLLRALGRSPD